MLKTNNAVVARKDSSSGNQDFDNGTLYLDYAQHNVGIGIATPHPGYSLDVDAMRAASIAFASPQIRRININPLSFQTVDQVNTALLDRHSSQGFKLKPVNPGSGTVEPLVLRAAAPVQLPMMANFNITIEALYCYIVDNDSVVDTRIQAGLGIFNYDPNLGGSFPLTPNVFTTGASPSLWIAQASPIGIAPIDNDIVFVSVIIVSSAPPTVGEPGTVFRGCYLEYTMSSLN